jgi:hypothetical protein
LRHDDPALEQERADLVHERGALGHQPVAHAVECLVVELVLALQRNEAHGGPRRSFGDRLGISVIVLLCLDVGPHILRRHQPYLVPLGGQHAARVMGAAARLHSGDAGRQLGCEREHRLAAHPPLHHDLARLVQPNNTAAVLAEIDTENRDLHGSAPFLS